MGEFNRQASALDMGSTGLAYPQLSLVSLCFIAMLYFPKEITLRYYLAACIEHLISAAHREANCPPACLKVITALMKQAMARSG